MLGEHDEQKLDTRFFQMREHVAKFVIITWIIYYWTNTSTKRSFILKPTFSEGLRKRFVLRFLKLGIAKPQVCPFRKCHRHDELMSHRAPRTRIHCWELIIAVGGSWPLKNSSFHHKHIAVNFDAERSLHQGSAVVVPQVVAMKTYQCWREGIGAVLSKDSYSAQATVFCHKSSGIVTRRYGCNSKHSRCLLIV